MAENHEIAIGLQVDTSQMETAADAIRSLGDATDQTSDAVASLGVSTNTGATALVDFSVVADAAGTSLVSGEADLSAAASAAAGGLVNSAGNALADAISDVIIEGESFEEAAGALAAKLSGTALDKLTDSLVDSLVDGIGGSLGSSGSSWSWLTDLFAFADGGVMTGQGPVELRKYASGGIADEPQLALFGEGASAEAYVPLPDGRSIPVTMKGTGQGTGAAAPSVSIQMSVAAQDAASFRRSEGQIGATVAAKLQRYMQRYG